eukprot:8853674-Pyramimonas_sp.AAC.1
MREQHLRPFTHASEHNNMYVPVGSMDPTATEGNFTATDVLRVDSLLLRVTSLLPRETSLLPR